MLAGKPSVDASHGQHLDPLIVIVRKVSATLECEPRAESVSAAVGKGRELELPILDVDQNLDIHPVYAPLCAHAGLAAVVDNARTPSFGLCITLLAESLLV